jgi:hypothetical protein
VAALADLIAAHIERWETASVERGVFRTTDVEALPGQLEAFAGAALGSAVRGGLFYDSSAGCVAGVALDDGRRLVMTAYQRLCGLPFLCGRLRRLTTSHVLAVVLPEFHAWA